MIIIPTRCPVSSKIMYVVMFKIVLRSDAKKGGVKRLSGEQNVAH